MDKQLLLTNITGPLQLAVLEDGALVELLADAADAGSLVGNLYVGRVENVLPGMDAAFVDIGLDQNALMPLADACDPAKIKPGASALVQVLKQPEQCKGPRLTQHITLPGRMAVLTPTLCHISVSKKIADGQERRRLQELAAKLCPDGMGLVIRTACEGAEEAALAQDIAELTSLWREIEKIAPYRKAPCLLRAATNLVTRALRDFLRPDVSELVVEGEALYSDALELATDDQKLRIRRHVSDIPLMSLYRVGAQFDKSLQRKVWLPGGGGLVFDYTEAMTVVDVNSGKFVGNKSLEETLLQTNLEAATELCRQLRLRDIGGIVVCDFIDMRDEEHRRKLLQTLQSELAKDRMKTTLHGMTKLGLVEITRKKDRSGMLGARAVCPTCKGTGRVEHKKKESP